MSASSALAAGDFPNRGPAVLAVTTATFVVATCFFVARLVSRACLVRRVDWDDWFMVLAWLFAFGLSFAVDYGTTKGLGRKDANIEEAWRPALRQSDYAFTVLYNPALMATKTSILIFYLRLSRNTIKLLRIASFITLGVVIAAGVVLTFLNIFQCRPVTAAFRVNTGSASQCIGIVNLYLASAPVNIITDIAVLLLPIPVLTSMNLPSKQKSILIFTFSLGAFVIAVDIVRIYYLQKAAIDQATGAIDSSGDVSTRINYTYNSSIAFMWSCVEVNVGIICACIPTLKPLIKRVLPILIEQLPGGTLTTRTATFIMQVQNGSGVNSIPLTHSPSRQSERARSILHIEEGLQPEMDTVDFLTTPDHRRGAVMNVAGDTNGGGTNLEPVRTETSTNSVYFGFVTMKRPKSMMKTRDMQSFKYCTMVTILFFLWGFSYGFLDTLNGEIGKLYSNTTTQTLGLQCAYFGAYAVGPLTIGQFTLRNGGFKATFICGLCIYGIGTLSFWPSAVLGSFAGFVISTFLTGLGLSVLETAANPFLALCGPMKHSEFRLLLAQSVQAVGSILSPLIAQKVLFRSIRKNPNLINVQWTYLGIAFFSVALAVFFYYMPLPEAVDDELQEQADKRMMNHFSENLTKPNRLFGTLPIVYTTLIFGVLAQWFYVAAQESVSVNFDSLLGYFIESPTATTPALSTNNYLLIGHATFALARFIFAFLCLYIAPRILLLVSITLSLVFTILTFAVSKDSSNSIASSILCLFFFEGPIWPLIFAISMRNLGKHTKTGAAFLTFGASGGAAFPFFMYLIQNGKSARIQYSFCIVIACFCVAILYPIYLFLPSVRDLYDDEKDEEEQRDSLGNSMTLDLCTSSRRDAFVCPDPPHSSIRRLSHGFATLFEKIKDGASRRSSCEGSLEPCVEHREQRKEGKHTPEV